MKILIVSATDTQGGAGRAAYRLHTSLLKANIDSIMLVLRKTSSDDSVIGPHKILQKITEEKLCIIYSKTRKIRDKIQQYIDFKCKYLSMGMSNDFEIAIKEGATHIRIGKALFGERPTKC